MGEKLYFSLAACVVFRAVADRRGPVFECREIWCLYSSSQARALPAGGGRPALGTTWQRQGAQPPKPPAEVSAAFTPGQREKITYLLSALRKGLELVFRETLSRTQFSYLRCGEPRRVLSARRGLSIEAGWRPVEHTQHAINE
ncbi:hypothetical protein DPMN_160688 [Dreissena polymorpha]|uniref:Uncharacterized protein n=1 Tax=Dreissena polymorpha TaxID=45954 RepID=A0A9D4ENB4_DREPO|nr:hypothetical protein DPMN_160688 [Dreissena polymorpha]